MESVCTEEAGVLAGTGAEVEDAPGWSGAEELIEEGPFALETVVPVDETPVVEFRVLIAGHRAVT